MTRLKILLLTILNCYLLTAQENHVQNNLTTLKYNYQLGKSYKYEKTTNRGDDKTYSYISLTDL